MRNKICLVAVGLWWALNTASISQASAQAPSVAATQTAISSEAKRVIATYAEMSMELQAQMAAGGRQTERMTELEARMAQEVKAAASELFTLVRNGDHESADAAA